MKEICCENCQHCKEPLCDCHSEWEARKNAGEVPFDHQKLSDKEECCPDMGSDGKHDDLMCTCQCHVNN